MYQNFDKYSRQSPPPIYYLIIQVMNDIASITDDPVAK